MSDATHSAVDLSRLPAPDLIDPLDFDTILADAVASMQGHMPDFVARESDPATKLLRVFAYHAQLHRQRINDAARAVMPAYAVGADLDHIAALFGVVRLTLIPADPASGRAAVMESDTDFRRRMVLAPEGYSVAGSEGGYIFHALSAHPDILDASATTPSPGEVVIALLSRSPSGAVSQEVIDIAASTLTAATVRPLTDHVTVIGAQILPYAVHYSVTTYSGPDAGLVVAASRAGVEIYVRESRRLGIDITRAGLIAAAHVAGVQNITLHNPSSDLIVSRTQAPYCTDITAQYAGIGE